MHSYARVREDGADRMGQIGLGVMGLIGSRDTTSEGQTRAVAAAVTISQKQRQQSDSNDQPEAAAAAISQKQAAAGQKQSHRSSS